MAVKNQNTGRKDRKIIIETWATSQNEGGGTSKSLASSYDMWANVQNRDGKLITSEEQREWTYDYKIEARYEKSRQITRQQTVIYDGKRLAISSITIDREGMREEVILKCSTIGNI